MKDAAFNWIKLALENWKVIIAVLTFAGSLFGNGLLAASNTEKDQMIDGQKKAIKVYSNLAYQASPKNPKIIKSNCNCRAILTQHIKDYH